MTTAPSNPDYISAMLRRSGYTAVLMRWNAEKRAYEAAQFGERSYLKRRDAAEKAREWATSLGVELKV